MLIRHESDSIRGLIIYMPTGKNMLACLSSLLIPTRVSHAFCNSKIQGELNLPLNFRIASMTLPIVKTRVAACLLPISRLNLMNMGVINDDCITGVSHS